MAVRKFTADLKRFAKKQNMTLDEAHRGIAISLFSSVVLDTPVDEGTLRANWNISNTTPDESTSEGLKDPTGSITTSKIKSHKMGAGDISFLTNAMPYAIVAEYGLWGTGDSATSKTTRDGYSIQAPYGMVRRNMARIQGIVSSEVQQAKRKVR